MPENKNGGTSLTKKRKVSIEKLVNYAIGVKDYEVFMTGAFYFDDQIWYARAEQFSKLCKEKEEENKISVPEYDLVVSDKVVARFYLNNQTPSRKLFSKIIEILKEFNIAYDYLKYEPEEKAYVAYKNQLPG